jgi:hypothetical protein
MFLNPVTNAATQMRRRVQQDLTQPGQPALAPPRPPPTPGSLMLQQPDGQQTTVPRPQPNPGTGQPVLQPPQMSGPASPIAPRPAPNTAGMTPPTPGAQAKPAETRTTDANGNVTIQGTGVRATIPADQRGNVGGYNPDQPPPGWDPRAWKIDNDDINSRQAWYYVGPNDSRVYGKSEGMGDSFASADEFRSYLDSLPSESLKQVARFANPKALQALWAADAAGQGAGGATGGPLMASATGGPLMASAAADGAGPGGFTRPGSYQSMLSGLSGTSVRPITGDERPMSILPGGGGSPLEGDLMSEALRQLRNPSVYDDELMQKGIDQARREAGRFYDEGDEQLRAELANRGIEYGGIAGGRYADLAADRQQGFQDMLLPLLRERATSIGGAREAAFNNAMRFSEFGDSRGRADRAEMRGERSYQDALADKARDQSIEEYLLGRDESRYNENSYQDLLRYAMGLGQGGAGLGALGGAAGIYGRGAGAYGDEAAGYNEDIGALLEMLFRNRGGGSGG